MTIPMSHEVAANRIEELEFEVSDHSAYLDLLEEYLADVLENTELEYINECVLELPYEKAMELLEKIEALK
ncbi:hypothetical protein [Bacillus smithii]|uniref:hypothetical protein n=1 Tax=Bacillus smithii TaxID=1479 RepID=UPI003D2481D9